MFNGVGAKTNALLSPTIPLALYALFQMKFAIITPSLITGSFAERVRFSAYMVFMMLITTRSSINVNALLSRLQTLVLFMVHPRHFIRCNQVNGQFVFFDLGPLGKKPMCDLPQKWHVDRPDFLTVENGDLYHLPRRCSS